MKKIIALSAAIIVLLSMTITVNAAETMYVVNCNQCVSLREYPSTSAYKITDVPLYSTVTSIGWQNGFNQVIYNGNVGWILSDYIDGGCEPQIVTYKGKVINCNEYITMRTSASTSGSVITTIPVGATVYKTWVRYGDFMEVSYNGYLGWVLAHYISEANY